MFVGRSDLIARAKTPIASSESGPLSLQNDRVGDSFADHSVAVIAPHFHDRRGRDHDACGDVA
jgi:hypothetical protein